jgi:hypothetical protein
MYLSERGNDFSNPYASYMNFYRSKTKISNLNSNTYNKDSFSKLSLNKNKISIEKSVNDCINTVEELMVNLEFDKIDKEKAKHRIIEKRILPKTLGLKKKTNNSVLRATEIARNRQSILFEKAIIEKLIDRHSNKEDIIRALKRGNTRLVTEIPSPYRESSQKKSSGINIGNIELVSLNSSMSSISNVFNNFNKSPIKNIKTFQSKSSLNSNRTITNSFVRGNTNTTLNQKLSIFQRLPTIKESDKKIDKILAIELATEKTNGKFPKKTILKLETNKFSNKDLFNPKLHKEPINNNYLTQGTRNSYFEFFNNQTTTETKKISRLDSKTSINNNSEDNNLNTYSTEFNTCQTLPANMKSLYSSGNKTGRYGKMAHLFQVLDSTIESSKKVDPKKSKSKMDVREKIKKIMEDKDLESLKPESKDYIFIYGVGKKVKLHNFDPGQDQDQKLKVFDQVLKMDNIQTYNYRKIIEEKFGIIYNKEKWNRLQRVKNAKMKEKVHKKIEYILEDTQMRKKQMEYHLEETLNMRKSKKTVLNNSILYKEEKQQAEICMEN